MVTQPVSKGITAVQPEFLAVLDESELGDAPAATGEATDTRIPILRILDPKSPQCKPVENGGIEGAKGGTIFDTATSEIYDGKRGLYVVPVYRDRKFVKYKKRDDNGAGGGFVGVYEPENPEVIKYQKERMERVGNLFGKLDAGQDDDGNDLELTETYYLYSICVVPNEDGSFPGEYGAFFEALVPFDSTKIKEFESFNNLNKKMRYNVSRNGKTAPETLALWAHVWHLSTYFFERGQQSWYKWRLRYANADLPYTESRLPKANPLFAAAEDFYARTLEGNAVVAWDKDNQGGGEPEAQPQGEYQGGSGPKDIPFGDQQ